MSWKVCIHHFNYDNNLHTEYDEVFQTKNEALEFNQAYYYSIDRVWADFPKYVEWGLNDQNRTEGDC